jgi:hypothetical protein
MNTKLTLRLDQRLIERAKAIGKAQGKSVSQMVADYVAALDASLPPQPDQALPPGVASLRGILRDRDVTAADYRPHLEH